MMEVVKFVYPYACLRKIPESAYEPIQTICLKVGAAVAFAVLAAWVQSDTRKAKELAESGKLLKLMKRYYKAMGEAQLTLAENTHLSVIEAAQIHDIPLKLSRITK